MGDCLPLPNLDGALRFYPSLGHGAIDEMPLDPFAKWASKTSEGLGQPRFARPPIDSSENRKQYNSDRMMSRS
jgi:hypothetical protein